MFDHSRAPAAGSKWRRVTAEELARAGATEKRLGLETQVLEAGAAPPIRVRRRVAKPKGPVASSTVQNAALWSFLAEHGRDIASLLVRTEGEDQQLALAQSYRDLRDGTPDAHDRWISLLRELDL
jgi:hypothetical protein